jgi:hypothetical protein
VIGAIGARLALALCAIGVVIPLYFGGPLPSLTDGLLTHLLGAACLLIPTVPPLAGLGRTAWAWRSDAAASGVLSGAAVLAVAVGWWGWSVGAEDEKGINLLFSALFVPIGQGVIWGLGGALAWRVARHPDPAA